MMSTKVLGQNCMTNLSGEVRLRYGITALSLCIKKRGDLEALIECSDNSIHIAQASVYQYCRCSVVLICPYAGDPTEQRLTDYFVANAAS